MNFTNFLRTFSPKGFLLLETIIVAYLYITKFMHDKDGAMPRSPSFINFVKLILQCWEYGKIHCFGDGSHGDLGPPLIYHCNYFVPHEGNSITISLLQSIVLSPSSSTSLHIKLHGPCLVIFANWTLTFEQLMVRLYLILNTQQDMCQKEIGLYTQNKSTILNSIVVNTRY